MTKAQIASSRCLIEGMHLNPTTTLDSVVSFVSLKGDSRLDVFLLDFFYMPFPPPRGEVAFFP